MPGIPESRFKFGLDFDVTSKWTIGFLATAQTATFLYGAEANLTKPLPGYFTADLTSRYQFKPRLQIFGGIDNVTATQYYEYGTFAPTGLAGGVYVEQAPDYSGRRSDSIAAPIAAVGGVKLTF